MIASDFNGEKTNENNNTLNNDVKNENVKNENNLLVVVS